MENNSENKFGNASIIREDCITPYYHCFVNEGISEVQVYNTLVEALKKRVANGKIIDFTFLPEQLRINCQLYSQSGAFYVPFVVQVFKTENGQLLFEFQRRRGDSSLFFNMYRECIADICNSKIIPETYRKEQFQSVVLKYEPSNDQKAILETASCLLKMSSSEFVDVKEEALEAITSLSFDTHCKLPMVKLVFVKQLLGFLQSNSEDVQRMSLSSLKHLTSIPEGREEFLKEQGIEKVQNNANANKMKIFPNEQMKREIQGIFNNVL